MAIKGMDFETRMLAFRFQLCHYQPMDLGNAIGSSYVRVSAVFMWN